MPFCFLSSSQCDEDSMGPSLVELRGHAVSAVVVAMKKKGETPRCVLQGDKTGERQGGAGAGPRSVSKRLTRYFLYQEGSLRLWKRMGASLLCDAVYSR